MCSFSPDIRDVLYKSFQQDNELHDPNTIPVEGS